MSDVAVTQSLQLTASELTAEAGIEEKGSVPFFRPSDGLINMQPMETHTHIVSIETAVAVTDRSRSTWWRHLSEGKVTRVADDARGRAMLSWADVAPEISVPMDVDELALVWRADAGEAESQNELGQIFLRADKFKSALYWLRQATGKNNADAMQWLGHCYVNGKGVAKDDYLGVMWLARAAALGHVIAQGQMRGLVSCTLGEPLAVGTAAGR